MSKRKLLIIVILLVVVLVIGLIFVMYFLPSVKTKKIVSSPPPITQPVTPIPAKNNLPASLSDMFSGEQAIEQKSFAPCQQLANELDVNNCLIKAKNSLFASSDSANFCLTLTDSEKLYQCVKDFVMTKDKVSECSVLNNEVMMNNCQADYAMSRTSSGNPAVCDIVKDADRKIACLDYAYFYQHDCAQIISEELKNNCTGGAY